jgi:hypothetical protein
MRKDKMGLEAKHVSSGVMINFMHIAKMFVISGYELDISRFGLKSTIPNQCTNSYLQQGPRN